MTRRTLPTVLATLLAASPGTGAGEEAVTLVVAQVPSVEAEALAGDTLRGDGARGGRIVLASPGGATRVLTAGFHSAAEPDVSFDGTRILFAGRREAEDPWCVWEAEIDSGETRKITCGPAGARQPVYLPRMYTLTPTSTEPWDQVAFVGSLPGETNEAGVGARTALFTCRLDGTRERQITFNLSSDFDPVVLPDGRMIFASWQRRSLDRGPDGRVALFGINIDGTDLMIFSGDEGRRVKQMPAYAGNRLVAFVEGDRIAGDGGGALSAVSLRRNLHSHRLVSDDGLYRSPSTHPAGGVLVAWRPGVGRDYAIHHLDPDSGQRALVYDDPEWHDVGAHVVASRTVPDGRSSSVRGNEPVGWLYGLDVGISDLGREEWPEGVAKRLRVLEGLPRSEGMTEGAGAPRRLLGEVDLEGDGSFHVQVPADTPVELQLLDEDGLALRSCAWIWTRWREARGCIGCHEDPERTPPNRVAEAVKRPAARLDLPAERRRFVDFRTDVWPIVERRCLACHDAGGATPRLGGGAGAAYDALLAAYVTPGRARTSRVMWHLLGRGTARPWDEVDAAPPKPMPEGSEPLSREEVLMFVQWIDLGALENRPMSADSAPGDIGGQP